MYDNPYTDNVGSVQLWLSDLTRAGYDIVAVGAYTGRNPSGVEMGSADYNGNMPWIDLRFHLRHATDARAPEIVLTSYSCGGGQRFTCYARVCWSTRSRATHMAFGFVVPGTERTERTCSSAKRAVEWSKLRSPPPNLDYSELDHLQYSGQREDA